MDHLRPTTEERGDFGAELTRKKLRHLRGLHFDPRLEGLHGVLEVRPGVLTPGIVLIEARNRLYVGGALHQIERDGHVIHRAGWTGAEHIFIARVLEDARRAAVEQDGELLLLLGNGRDRQAIAARDVADHDVDPWHEIAILGHLLLRATRRVDDDELDRRSAEALLGIGCGYGARV